jgi:hypothetical protein
MKRLQKRTRSLLVGAGLMAGSLGFSAGATAGLDYSGYGEIFLKLVDVNNPNCNSTTGDCSARGNWSVSSKGLVAGSGATTSGSGLAYTAIDLLPMRDWTIGSEYFQSAESYGEAGVPVTSPGPGFASSFTLTDFSIYVENLFRGQGDLTLDFTFDYWGYVSADLGLFAPALPDEDGDAYAGVELFDDFSDVEQTSTAVFVGGSKTGDYREFNGSWQFTLLKGEANTLTGLLDTDGSAISVPVPATVWLFGCGLLGLIWQRGTAARKH